VAGFVLGEQDGLKGDPPVAPTSVNGFRLGLLGSFITAQESAVTVTPQSYKKRRGDRLVARCLHVTHKIIIMIIGCGRSGWK